ncbi:hypothetical protein REPUB_Repub10bG0145600 [Reevesia pubescens]
MIASFSMGTDTPQVQLSFYDYYGTITPTKLDDYFLKMGVVDPNALAIFCTLTSYEANLTTKRGKFIGKTRAKIICGLREMSEVVPVPVCSSIYMARQICEVIWSVAKQISFYQWKNSTASDIKISGLEIVAFNLTNHIRQSLSRPFQMTAPLSFSTFIQRLRVFNIAVLARSTFRQFVNLGRDQNLKKPHLQGLSVDVFKAAAAVLPYHFSYKLVPFYGSCDQLMEEVARKVTLSFLYMKAFDAAAGGIVITAEKSQIVEFSQPYAELRMVMVVMKTDNGLKLNGVFWFISPFTREMWLILATMTIFTGLVIWFIELRTHNESAHSSSRQVAAVFCFPFAFLFNELRPTNRLSYFLLVPWLLLTLIVTMVFTANLGSMVTSSQVEPSGLDISSIKRTNAAIGCDGNSFTVSCLVNNLGFKLKNIKNIGPLIDDYEKALTSGNIKAAFLLIPDAKLFLAKYCRGFTTSGQTYYLGSFGFVFPRYSPLASDMSEAILKLKEAGEFLEMEETDMLSASDCSSWSTSDDQTVSTTQGIGPGPFTGLFIFSGGASATALLITIVRVLRRRWESSIQRILMGRGLWGWLATTFFSLHNQVRNCELQLSPISSTSQVQQINNS